MASCREAVASNGDSAAEDSGLHGLGSHVVYLTLKADSRTKVEHVRLDKSLAAAFVSADGNPCYETPAGRRWN